MLNIIKYIQESLRKKELRKRKIAIKGEYINIKSVKSLGFLYPLYSKEDLNNLRGVLKILERKGIAFSGIIVDVKGSFPVKKQDESARTSLKLLESQNIITVYKDELNWIGIPKSEKLKDIYSAKYDLFINFDNQENFTAEYIFRGINVICMIGMVNHPDNIYDIVFTGEKGTILNEKEYLEKVFYYLDVIKGVKK